MIRPVINSISGQQRIARKSIVTEPLENADAYTSDQFTKVIMWVVNKENVLETISQAFEGSLTTGMNLLHVWMDYRTDPISGDIKVDNLSYNQIMVDTWFRKSDLSDCNGILKRSYLTKRECISLMPDKAEEILSLTGYGTGSGKDGKFQFMPEAYQYTNTNLLTYDEFYYRDFRTQKIIVDVRTGETVEWKIDDKERLEQFLEEYPELTVIEQEIPTVRLGILIEGKVFYDGPQPLGIDIYPFVPVLTYYNPQIPYYPWRIQGVVRGLRDAAFLYNHRRRIEFDILESQINSGYIYKEGSLINPADIFLTGQGRGLALKRDAMMSDVQKIEPAKIDPSTFVVSEKLAKDFSLLSGINEEALGSAIDDKAGILAMLRQRSSQIGLQPIFDHLDIAQQLIGEILVQVIPTNFTPGKIKAILGEEPAPYFYDKAFGKYKAVVADGLNTTSQKQAQFAQMVELRQMGLPITPEDLLEAATFQNKDRIIKNMQQAEQAQQQMQQKQAEMEMELQMAQIELARARAKADLGLSEERSSRVADNRSLAIERLHKANQEDSQATLNKIKTLREIDEMDFHHIEKLLNIVNSLKQNESNISETSIGKIVE